MQVAAQTGAKRIILLGFDMTVKRGVHWHGPHGEGLRNPKENSCHTWRRAFRDAAPVIERLGIEVINCSRETALTCFPREPLEDVLCRLSQTNTAA